MTNPKILCAMAHGRVKALVKQLQSIKAKQRYTDVDQTRSAKFRVLQLRMALDWLRRDYAIIEGLPEQLSALVKEWLLQMARIEDEASRDDARQKYLDILPETEWQTNIAAKCDEALRQLATSIRFCEETIPTLTGELTTEERAGVDEFLTPSRVPRALPQYSLQPLTSPSQDARPPFSPFSSTYVTPKLRSTVSHNCTNRENASQPAHTAGGSFRAGFGGAFQPAHPAGGLPPATSSSTTLYANRPTDQTSVETTSRHAAGPNRISREKTSPAAHSAGGSFRAGFGGAHQPAHPAGGPSPVTRGNSSQSKSKVTKPRQNPRAGLGFYTDASRRSLAGSTTADAAARLQEPGKDPTAVTSLQQLSISEVQRSPCVFCNHSGHRSTHCLNYGTLEKRLLRAARTCVCVSCCSTQPEPHLWKACPHEPLVCVFCKQRGHHQSFCRSWLRIFSNRISRRLPQTNTRKNPTRGRSTTTSANAAAEITAKPRALKPVSRSTNRAPCRQRRCICHRLDCEYVIPRPWKTTDTTSSSVLDALTKATQSLNGDSSDANAKEPKIRNQRAEQHPSKAPPSVPRGGFTSRGGARNNLQRPSRNAADSLKALMCSSATDDHNPCGHCRSCSAPLRVGADGKPFIGATDAVPPDFAAVPVCHARIRPPRIQVFSWPRYFAQLRREQKRQAYRQNPTHGRGPSNVDSDDEFCCPNSPLSKKEQHELEAALALDIIVNQPLCEQEQLAFDEALESDDEFCRPNTPLNDAEARAFDAALDSDNDYGSPYATTPYARPFSPSGGFGPLSGHEFETHEDLAFTAEEEYDWPNEPSSTPTLMPHSIGTGIAREPELLLAPGTSAQQTSRDTVYEDHAYEDDLYEDHFHGGDPQDDRLYDDNPYEDRAYGACVYEERDYGGDFYDDDSVRWA